MKQKALVLSVVGVGLLVLIVGALLFAARAERTNVHQTSTVAPSVPSIAPKNDRETGPATVCTQDSDCWCRIFTGAEFLPGRAASDCQAGGHCAPCYYE